jgi:hypothetical protein
MNRGNVTLPEHMAPRLVTAITKTPIPSNLIMKIASYSLSAVLVISTLTSCSLAASGTADRFAAVTNANDSGPGSLRHAIEVQGANVIFIDPSVGTININATIEYSLESPLTLIGTEQTIATQANATLLAITSGANVYIQNINFEGPGGWSILNRGDQGAGPAGKGIFVAVRDDQTGTLEVMLNNVRVSGVANHGIHISDCSLADDCGGGGGGAGDGSAASIQLVCNGCVVDDAGNGKFDADGIRIDDRGEGSITAVLNNSSFTNVGADGVEVDEGNNGDVWVSATNSVFNNNGGYCAPDIIEPFIPDPNKAEFTLEEAVEIDAIPTAKPGSPDDACIEREVDLYPGGIFVESYEFSNDVDDGIDGDEAGPGSLNITMRDSIINDNLDEGVDMDEADSGSIIATYNNTSAKGNTDDGFKHSEADAGSIFGQINNSTATDNGGKGFVFKEEGDGDLAVTVVRSAAFNNDDSDKTGIKVRQKDAGTGVLRVRASDIADGIDADGIDVQ